MRLVLEILREAQEALFIPWGPGLLKELAAYPAYLELAWSGLAPVVRSEPFHLEAEQLRLWAQESAAGLYAPNFQVADPRLAETWELMLYGDAKLLLIACQLFLAMLGEMQERAPEPARPPRPHDLQMRQQPLVLVDEEHAPEFVRAIYRQIKQHLAMPLVTTEYQAAANWPDFLDRAWRELSKLIPSEGYQMAEAALRARACAAARRLGLAMRADERAVRALGIQGDRLKGLQGTLGLFFRGMPGSCLSAALMRLACIPPSLVRTAS